MPIVYNESQPLATGGGRSAAPITDTYVRPAYHPDQDVNNLAESLSKLGVAFSSAGAQRAAEQEKLQARNVEVYATILDDAKRGGPLAAQQGLIPPQMSPTVNAMVNETLGSKYADRAYFELAESLAKNYDLSNMPQDQLDGLLQAEQTKQLELYKNDPSTMQGFISRWMQRSEQLRTAAMTDRKAFLEKVQEERLVERTLDAHTEADKAEDKPFFQYPTADTANLPVLKSVLNNDASHLRGMKKEFAGRLETMLEAMPENLRNQVTLNSGYRSVKRQQQLWDAAVKKYGSEAAANKWVGRPGGSMHNHGEAGDLGVKGVKASNLKNTEAGKWIHDNAEKFGLYFPLSNEAWHIEMIGGRRQGASKASPNHRYQVDNVDDLEETDSSGDFVKNIMMKVRGSESNYNRDADNPDSSALGIDQWMPDTWVSRAKLYAPEETKGLTDAQILSMRSGERFAGIQDKVMYGFTKENIEAVKRTGNEVTPGNVKLMHMLGEEGGPKLLRASDGTRAEQVISEGAMKANRKVFAGKTVAQIKEWAESVTDGVTKTGRARQNITRLVDQEAGQMGSLNPLKRREILTKTLYNRAIQTLDVSWLERMPPELMTPDIEAQFTSARQKIIEDKYNMKQRQWALEQQAKKARTETMVNKINQAEKDGVLESLDPAEFVGNDDAYAVYRARMQPIQEGQSEANALTYESNFQSALIAGDFGIVNPEWKDRNDVTIQEYASWLKRRPDVRPEHIQKYLDKVPAMYETFKAAGGESANREFKQLDSTIQSYQKVYDDNYGPMAQGGLSIAFEDEARNIYDTYVQEEFKAWVETHGKAPPPLEQRRIFREARNEAKSHLKELLEDNPMVKKLMEANKDAVRRMDGKQTLRSDLNNQTPREDKTPKTYLWPDGFKRTTPPPAEKAAANEAAVQVADATGENAGKPVETVQISSEEEYAKEWQDMSEGKIKEFSPAVKEYIKEEAAKAAADSAAKRAKEQEQLAIALEQAQYTAGYNLGKDDLTPGKSLDVLGDAFTPENLKKSKKAFKDILKEQFPGSAVARD